MRIVILVLLFSSTALARPFDFAVRLCKEQPDVYECIKIKVPRGNKKQYYTWEELYPNGNTRHLLQNINRRNTLIWTGHFIARPKKSLSLDNLSFSPLPDTNEYINEKSVVVDLSVLAWGAYEKGRLIRWGVANGGSKICSDTKLYRCKTPPGEWNILYLKGPVTRSKLYPIECKNHLECGFPMLYMSQFRPSGEGLHGAKWVPGRNASHGCVRVLPKDAWWLNKKFLSVGTKVIVRDY